MDKSQIIIDIGPQVRSVALLENGVLSECFVESGNPNFISGNIYKGKVINVLDGLQTAFVECGLRKKGFLYVGETLSGGSDLQKNGLMPSKLNVLAGDYIMVQATKEETESKGARLSANISLPGRYVVYMPTFEFVGVSNKITDESTRERLTDLITSFKADGEGFIARTISADADSEVIKAEALELKAIYKTIFDKYNQVGDNVSVVHTEGDIILRTLRDMLRNTTCEIICNDKNVTQELISFLKSKNSIYEKKVKFYEDKKDILSSYGIIDAVDKLLDKKAELPSGGSLIIEKTEALTVIDVNTARFQGIGDREKTVFITNCEAAKEIAKQIRLRNIGGIIVVDFIDMLDEKNQEQVVDILRKEVTVDRIKTRVLDMTGLGLVEITRKKVGNELGVALRDKCGVCQGAMASQSNMWLCRKIKAELTNLFASYKYENAIVSVVPELQNYIFQSGFFGKEINSIWEDKRIYIITNDSHNKNVFFVTGSDAGNLTLPNDAKLLY